MKEEAALFVSAALEASEEKFRTGDGVKLTDYAKLLELCRQGGETPVTLVRWSDAPADE